MIRVVLPTHLWRLANTSREIEVQVEGPATIGSVLDALEARYPMLRGTLRDHVTKERRPFIRFFACGEDLSLESPDSSLPAEVATGKEPLRIVGAMAGGQVEAGVMLAGEGVKRFPNPDNAPEAQIEIRPMFEEDDLGSEFTPGLSEQEARLRAQSDVSAQRAVCAGR